MYINNPYTLDYFYPVGSGLTVNFQDEYLGYQVGQTVAIQPGFRTIIVKVAFEKLGYPCNQAMTIKELIVGMIGDCVVNCQLPNGEIFSSHIEVLELVNVVHDQEKQKKSK